MQNNRSPLSLALLSATLLVAALSCRSAPPPPVPLSQEARTTTTLSQPPVPSPVPADPFAIYGLDPGSASQLVIRHIVQIPRDLSLADRVHTLADELSELRFQNAPIQLLRIEETEDEWKIAVLDVQLLPDGRDLWRETFFQGSTGGTDTKQTLVETFLQRNYPGEWIDGVQFLYLGRFLRKGTFDHIDLSEVYYRRKQ